MAQSSFGLWPAAGEECVEYCKTWFTQLVQEISRSARLGTLLRSEHRLGEHITSKKVQRSYERRPAKIGTLLKKASVEGTDWASALPSILVVYM